MEVAGEARQNEIDDILGEDPATFEILITQLMSPDNDNRCRAEEPFNACKEQRPDGLTLKLLHALQSSHSLQIREMATILLRLQIIKLWSRLQPSTQTSVKSALLLSLESEEVETIVKKLSATLTELAASIPREFLYLELLPFVFPWLIYYSPRHKKSVLSIFAQLPRHLLPHNPRHMRVLYHYFRQSMAPIEPWGVRIEAIRATANCNFVEKLLPAMLDTLTDAINHNQGISAQKILKIFIELVGTQPLLLLWSSENFGGFMLEIAETESQEEGTRHLAIEFMITLFEECFRAAQQGIIAGSEERVPEELVKRLYVFLIKLLIHIEGNPAWHAANEDAGDSGNYCVAREYLYRLAVSGGKTALSFALSALPIYLTDANWCKRHAALIALTQILEGCDIAQIVDGDEVMIKIREQVVNMVLILFNDPNQHVQLAAINVITIQGLVLPRLLTQVKSALVKAMENTPDHHVQTFGISVLTSIVVN